MGLVVDLAKSGCDVSTKQVAEPDFNVISNRVVLDCSGFKARFAFKFDKHAGVAPPRTTEYWRIGVVQNVLYEKMRFVYEGRAPIAAEFVKATVDSNGGSAFPFYDEPIFVARGDMFGGIVPNPKRMIPAMWPYREVYYNPKGFGELLEPWSSFPDDVVTMSSASVDLIDAPYFGCKLRDSAGRPLVKAEQIVSFGIWLVATDYDMRRVPQVLAHIEPFTMVYSVTLTPSESLLSYPAWSRFYYTTRGLTRTASAKLGSAALPGLRVFAGKGWPGPILKGETANNRDKQWAEGHLLQA